MTIKVLIADDQQMIAEGIAALLSVASDLTVVSKVCNPNRIGVEAALWKPDVALVDVCMGGVNGVKAAAMIRHALRGCRVLGLSAYDDPALVTQMVDAGASGYVVKSQAAAELIEAIRIVAAGGTCYKGVPPPATVNEKRALSAREHQYLVFLAGGGKAAAIAAQMGVSPKTVETYRRRVMKKLNITSQYDLFRCAGALGGEQNVNLEDITQSLR